MCGVLLSSGVRHRRATMISSSRGGLRSSLHCQGCNHSVLTLFHVAFTKFPATAGEEHWSWQNVALTQYNLNCGPRMDA